MDSRTRMEAAFLDELEKIAASFKQLNVPKGRSGRRSISVENFLKKDKDGKLFRKHAFTAGYEDGPHDTGAAKPPKKKGEVPSRDDTAPSSREDGRENAVNVNGPATLLSDVAAVGGS